MRILTVIFSLFIFSCVTVLNDPLAISKPALHTNVPNYLDNFPLNLISKQRLVDRLGVPDKTSEFEGKTYYSYELGENYGKRQWVFEIMQDVVTDVRYHDQGPYNGQSARQRQGR